MLRHRHSTAWGVSLGMGRHDRSWHWCKRLRQWCASRIMPRRHVPSLARGSRSESTWAQLRPPTPTCALEYVASQNGPGWAIALHSALPY
jgi:hypothetical protein